MNQSKTFPRRLRTATLAALVALIAQPVAPAASQGSGFTMFMSPEQEKKVGAEEHPKILARFGGAYDERGLGGYVAGVGRRLLGQAAGNEAYRFTLLNSPVVNAFALPGGYVYVTRGILALANNEAELAGVLAHEIGHVKARHSAQRYSKSIVFGLGALAAGALFNSKAIADVANVGSELYLRSFSRDQEFEADSLGVQYLAQNGYPTIAMAAFLESLNQHSAFESELAGQKGSEPAMDFFSTHPRTADRVSRAIAQAGAPPAKPFFGRDAYLNRIDGMLYDDDPSQGFIRGQSFLHPTLRFAFDAPPEFRLINTSTAVVAQGPSGSGIRLDQEADPKKVAAARNLRDYVTRIWAGKQRLQDVEDITINGMDAVTGRTQVQGQNGPVDVRLVAIDFSEKILFRFTLISPTNLTKRLNADFQRSTYSFRRLDESEAGKLEPFRLAVLPVERADAEDYFISMMAQMDGSPEQRFRVLNGLRGDETIAPGQRVKIVRD